METKICSKCKLEKKLSEFDKQVKGRYAHRANCKLCCKKYKDEHKEAIKQKNKEYYANHKKQTLKERIKELEGKQIMETP